MVKDIQEFVGFVKRWEIGVLLEVHFLGKWVLYWLKDCSGNAVGYMMACVKRGVGCECLPVVGDVEVDCEVSEVLRVYDIGLRLQRL